MKGLSTMKYTSRRPAHTINSSAYVSLATIPEWLKTTMATDVTPRATTLNANQSVGYRRFLSNMKPQPTLYRILKTVFPNLLGWLSSEFTLHPDENTQHCLPAAPDVTRTTN
jgi:hypothetical protein